MQRILLLVVTLLGLGAGAFFLLGGGQVSMPKAPGSVDTISERGGDYDPVSVASASDDSIDRSAAPTVAGEGLPPLEHAELALTGRVTDTRGNAIANARVRVQYRQSFVANGLGRRGNNGPGGAGAAAGFRGFRGSPQELTPADRARLDEMRSRFQPQDVGAVVVTSVDGRYRVQGSAYSNATLSIGVTHDAYAPTLERREWQAAMGEMQLDDIVLHAGVVVTGTVVDENELTLAGAEVSYEPADDTDTPFGGGPDGGNARGGRGGRGGGPGGFGGWGGDPVAALVGKAVTDASGYFRLGPIPAEPFQLVATLVDHLDAHGRRTEPADGEQLQPQRLIAVAAVGITGVVRDADGTPIANARITGEVSRDAMFAQFRAQREAQQQDQAAATGNQAQPGERGGRRGQGQGPGGVDFARMREAMSATESTRSNDQGEFVLTKLPRAQIKLTAEHRQFLTTIQEPIDGQITPNVELVMPAALSVAGVVVDAATGGPVARFGIAARRIDPPADTTQGFGRRGGQRGQQSEQGRQSEQGQESEQGRGQGGRRGRGNGNQQGDEQAAAQVAARTAWLREQLGPAARLPGRTPQPTAHADGTFVLDGLQSGAYGFDIDAPGFIRTATEAIRVDGVITGLVLKVEPGAVLRGRVELRDHTPVAGASVELLMPEPPAELGPIDLGRGGGPGGGNGGGFGGRRGGGGGPGGAMRLARVDSNEQGMFELPPVRQGVFRLRVQKDGLIDYVEPSVQLPAAGNVREVTVTMSAGGTVTGVVSNVEPGVVMRVTLTNAADRSEHSAMTDVVSGEYTITGLPPGGYMATLNQFGRDAEARRTQLANAVVQRDKQAPDLMVAAGGTTKFDMVAGQDALGAVLGTVFLNGAPGVGMQVRLNRIEDPNAAPELAGGRGGRGNQGGDLAQLLRAIVAADGTWSMTAVPPGSYSLEVRQSNGGGRGGRGGRGGGGGGASFRQQIEVAAYSQIRVPVDLLTSAVEIRVTVPEALADSGRLRVGIALASEVGALEPDQWRRLGSYQSFRLNSGTTGVQNVAPGNYRYQVSGRGILPLTGDLIVGQGMPATLSLAAEAAPQPDGAQPGNGNNDNGAGGAAGGQGGGRGNRGGE